MEVPTGCQVPCLPPFLPSAQTRRSSPCPRWPDPVQEKVLCSGQPALPPSWPAARARCQPLFLSAGQGVEPSRTLCSERGPRAPSRPVAPDLPPSCPSCPRPTWLALALAWPWHGKEATAALSEARTVPPATACALSPEDRKPGRPATGHLSEASGRLRCLPSRPRPRKLALPVSNPAEPRGESTEAEDQLCVPGELAQPGSPLGEWRLGFVQSHAATLRPRRGSRAGLRGRAHGGAVSERQGPGDTPGLTARHTFLPRERRAHSCFSLRTWLCVAFLVREVEHEPGGPGSVPPAPSQGQTGSRTG